jgi:hypothetical protein
MADQSRSDAAKTLSKAGASKGGRARAANLTAQQRQDIARRAVQARWEKAGKPIVWTPPPPEPEDEGPRLPYSLYPGILHIGDIDLECHVLDNGRRVLTQRQVVRILSGGRDSSNLMRYLERNPLYSPESLDIQPIQFMVPPRPQPAAGYEGTLLVDICQLYLEAREAGLLKDSQMRLARMAEIVVRSCAKVGINALIDEATGYQEVRSKQSLQLMLQAFIADEMQEWALMFPEEFWLELARLEGIRYSPRNRPLRWGKYIMQFVYDAIDPELGKELRKLNPTPHYRKNHHQWLKQYGRERIHDQLQRIIAVMKMSDSMRDFERKFEHVFNRKPLQLSFEELWTDVQQVSRAGAQLPN